MGKAAEEDVLGNAQMRKNTQFLIDYCNAEFASVQRPLDVDFVAINADNAAILALSARKDLHQRRLASAIFAEQGMHLPFADRERYSLQGLDPWESLLNVLHLKNWWHSHPSCRSRVLCTRAYRPPTARSASVIQ